MASDSWKFDIAGLVGKIGKRRDVEVVQPIGDVANTVASVADTTPIELSGHLEAIEGLRVVFEGKARAAWSGECRRCAGPVSGEVNAVIREIYERNATEGETYPVDGTTVNLQQATREAVMVQLPDAPLCSEDCAGLCAVCGVDLNEATCDCAVDLSDPRWAALDQLKTPPQG